MRPRPVEVTSKLIVTYWIWIALAEVALVSVALEGTSIISTTVPEVPDSRK